MAQRRKILFFGEGVTLAHVGRPYALAAGLPRERFEPVVACPPRYQNFAPPDVDLRPLESQSPEAFEQRLAQGRRLYSEARLEAYVAEDLRLIKEVRPDLVVGDFRLSLAASAREARVPYVSISNAYWDPRAPWRPPPPPLTELKSMPPWAGRALFRLAGRRLMRWHAEPIAAALARCGVEIGADIRRAFTEADLTLYADFPSLHPKVRPSSRSDFLGPLAWQPDLPLPAWWDEPAADRPIAYCTLGSSGAPQTLQLLAEVLLSFGFTVLAATAGRAQLRPAEHLFAADYLPGRAAAARARLVVCNGGAPTANQALLEGKPVLGVCSNMDQLLNMQAVERAGAGIGLRSDQARPARLTDALETLARPHAAGAAARLAAEGAACDPHAVFLRAVEQLTANPRSAA